LVGILLQQATPAQRLLLHCWRAEATAAGDLVAAHPGLVANLRPEDQALVADAAWAHRLEAVRLMLELGFPVEAAGIHDSTALDRAALRGYLDLVQLMLSRGASLEARNEFGGAPLGACIWGSENFRDPEGDYPACVEALLNAGAPLPETAGGNPEVGALLRQRGASAG